MKKLTCLLIVLLGGIVSMYSQSISVQGNVTDENNIPLLGVTILVKNESRGTTTDFDGNFVIENINSGDVLQFSFIGFLTREITITNQKTLSVQLQNDSQSLDEVLVIGYGTQTKKEITGAVSVIDSKTIEDLNPVRVEQALQGRVAGVNITSQSGSPGSSATINIRGISTNGDNRPLILVDGNRIEDLSVINPNDIASINVLKDATAGIYGVQAANGVILITTKSGKRNTDLKVDFDVYTGIQETTREIPVLNATEYAVIINEAHTAAGINPPFPIFNQLGMGTDWQEEVFGQAPISDININVTGGGEKSTYSFGGGYFSQDGIVGKSSSNYDRLTARLNYTLEVIENLKFNTSAIYTRTTRKSLSENALGSVLFNALNMSPLLDILDENGEFTLAEGLGNEVINPIAQIANTFNETEVNKISGVFGLEYKFFDKIKAKSQFQFNYAEVEGIEFFPEVFYGSGKVFNVDRNRVVESNDLFRDYIWDNYVTYEDSFGDHNLKVLLGMSVSETSGDFNAFTGFEIPGNSFANASIANAIDVVDNFINGGDIFKSRLLSYFSRIQYDYKGKYLFSGLIRRDGSSKFGPKNKFGYFPSASAGWIITEEKFLQENEVLNFLKLRGSYGIIGNDRIEDFRFTSLLNGEGAYVFDNEIVFGVAAGALANPEVKWEKQKTLDIGLDARFLNSKLDLTIDYFKRRTEDLLVVVPVSGILGASAPGALAPIINAGVVENSGFEFQVGYTENLSDDFKFNVNYNFTTLDNEVILVNSENSFIAAGSFGIGLDPPSRMEAGKPIGYFFGLETDGIFQTQAEVDTHTTQANAAPGDLRYIDQNNDGVIDTQDRVDIGDPIPEVTMGMNIGFTYKNFDFNTYAFASIGNDIVRNYERNQPLTNKTLYHLDRWTGANSTNSFPRVTVGTNSNNLFSDFYVEDGSYLRLQNIQLGYTIDDKVLSPTGIDSFRIYASVNNAITLTKYKGYDPSASSGEPIGGGIDQGFYPVPRVYMMGVNLKF